MMTRLDEITRTLRREGHPLATYFADQARILGRLESYLNAPSTGTALGKRDRTMAESERASLEAILGKEIEILQRNGELDRKEVTRLNVRDFGATGDGRTDDGPALREAFRAASEAGPGCVLAFPRGNYRIEGFADPRRRYALALKKARDLILDGEPGTRLTATEVGGVLLLEECENVRVRDIELDHDPLPYTEGRVESVEASETAFVWKRTDGFPAPDQGHFTLLSAFGGSVRHPEDGSPMGRHGGMSIDAKVMPLGDGRYRLRLVKEQGSAGKLPESVQPGVPYCLHTRGIPGRRCALWVDACSYCDFERVHIRASFHFAIMPTHSTATKFRGCDVVPAEGRLSGINADGFHCKSNRHGPYIENCRVLNTMDDCGNLYCRAASAIQRVGDRELIVDALWNDEDRFDGWGWQPERRSYREGDQMMLIDPETGTIDAIVRIEAITAERWRGTELVKLTFDGDIPELRTRDNLGKEGILPLDSYYLRRPEDERVEHFALNLATKSDGFVIRDCHMGRNTVTAWKIKASNGLFENNRFERHGWCCINLFMELMWQEGFAARNILIQGNHFANRFGVNAGCGYPIQGARIGPPYIRGIDIVENTFLHDDEGFSVRLGHIRESHIRRNRMSGARPLEILGSTVGARFDDNTTDHPNPRFDIEPDARGITWNGVDQCAQA